MKDESEEKNLTKECFSEIVLYFNIVNILIEKLLLIYLLI